MLNGIREKGLGVLNWTPEAEQYRIRLHCAARWLPEYVWRRWMMTRYLRRWKRLLPQMSGVHSLRALKALDVKVALQNLLDWSLRQRLDSELRGITLCRPAAGLPFVITRIIHRRWRYGCRKMFGEATTPSIAEGRVPVVLELLSPAHRPLQITRDLGAFWAGATVKCKRDERALSQTCLAGRSGEYGTDTADEEIFVKGSAA